MDHRIVCFTDDGSGIDDAVEIAPLPSVDQLKVRQQIVPPTAKTLCPPPLLIVPSSDVPALARPSQGWWYKAYLFSNEARDLLGEGKQVLYIDLDTVLVGSLDELADFRGACIGVLSTDMMESERRSGGINSSVMTWTAGEFTEIWSELERHSESVKTITYKFDAWVEMMLPRTVVRILQSEISTPLLEYGQVQKAGGELPVGACLVTFPLTPKPHECVDDGWVKLHWNSSSGLQLQPWEQATHMETMPAPPVAMPEPPPPKVSAAPLSSVS